MIRQRLRQYKLPPPHISASQSLQGQVSAIAPSGKGDGGWWYVVIVLLPYADRFIDRARHDGLTCAPGGDPLDGIHVPRMCPQRDRYPPPRRILSISANMKPWVLGGPNRVPEGNRAACSQSDSPGRRRTVGGLRSLVTADRDEGLFKRHRHPAVGVCRGTS
jgi:hypothetical protein